MPFFGSARPAGALWRYGIVAQLFFPRVAASQLPDGIPPEPAHDADLPTLASWIERWLPVVGAVSYATIDSTADFYSHRSDSVTSARLEGCTLVLHERLISMANSWVTVRHLAIRVPLDQVDTSLVQPKMRQTRVLLGRPNVVLTGQLVVPLRNRARTEFITVYTDDDPLSASLVGEHQVPIVFAQLPATRSASAIRQAAAYCASASAP